MIETLATTNFSLTFRTMKRLIPQAESRSKWHEDNLDESENTLIQKVCGGFTGLKEDRRFLDMRSASDGQYPDFRMRHISDLTLPLTREMAERLAEGDGFIFHSDSIDRVSSEVYASFLKHLMAAISAEKFLFVACPLEDFESRLEILIHHCRHCQLQAVAGAGQMRSNLEIHTVNVPFHS